jgi:hypothetical protein
MGLLGDMGGFNNWDAWGLFLNRVLGTDAAPPGHELYDDPNARFGMLGKSARMAGQNPGDIAQRKAVEEAEMLKRQRQGATAMTQPKGAPIDTITPDMEATALQSLLAQLNKITHKPNEFSSPQETAMLEQQRGTDFADQQQQQANVRYADFVGSPGPQQTPPELNQLTAPNAVAGGGMFGGAQANSGKRDPSADELRGMKRFGGGYADRVSNAKGEQMGRRMRMESKRNQRGGMNPGMSLRQTLLSFAPQFRANADDNQMRQSWMNDPAIMALLQPPDPRQQEADNILQMALNRSGSFVG